MCMSGSSGAAEAEANRQRVAEEARQGRITAGRNNINSAFAGYDDDFYAARTQSYLDYANPQLENQFEDATRDLTLALARSGLSNSSVKSRRFADLQRSYDDQSRAVADKATKFSSDTRGSMENAKSELLNQNQNIANPSLMAQQAASRASTSSSLPAYQPLAQLFNSATAGLSTQADLERRGHARHPTGLFSTQSSGKVIGSV